MKNFTRLVLCILPLLLAFMITLPAQETRTSKITVEQKTVKEDGTIHVTKKQIPDSELAGYLDQLSVGEVKNLELNISIGDDHLRINRTEDGTLQYARKNMGINADLLQNPAILEPINNINQTPQVAPQPAHAPRPLLGIYADDAYSGEGVKIGSLSTVKGVAAAGLKAGDIITTVRGKEITPNFEIRDALRGSKPGEQVEVIYLRAGKPTKAIVTLVAEGAYSTYVHSDPCAVFIGVGTSIRAAGGLKVEYIVGNTPAEMSDVRAGDVILSLDGETVLTQHELEIARNKHKQGEAFRLQILRNDNPMTIDAKFKECDPTQVQQRKVPNEVAEINFLQRGLTKINTPLERDPCKVFIGVYTYKSAERGMRVNGVIDNTSAKRSGIQKGDIILALDDVEVNDHEALMRERDKHKPGDRFILSVLRQGAYLEIDAQFSPCGDKIEPAQEETSDVMEAIIVPETTLPATQPLLASERLLKVEAWNAFPNPSYGVVNVQFEVEAKPTQVQIFDVTGKKVYEEVLNKFDGFYKKELNLENQKPGVYILTVRQGEKVYNNKLVLLAKA